MVDDLVVYRGLLSCHASVNEAQTVLFSEHLETVSNLTKLVSLLLYLILEDNWDELRISYFESLLYKSVYYRVPYSRSIQGIITLPPLIPNNPAITSFLCTYNASKFFAIFTPDSTERPPPIITNTSAFAIITFY